MRDRPSGKPSSRLVRLPASPVATPGASVFARLRPEKPGMPLAEWFVMSNFIILRTTDDTFYARTANRIGDQLPLVVWTGEYPNATVFTSLKAARAVYERDALLFYDAVIVENYGLENEQWHESADAYPGI